MLRHLETVREEIGERGGRSDQDRSRRNRGTVNPCERSEDGPIATVLVPRRALPVERKAATLSLATSPASFELVIDLNEVAVLSSAAIHRIREGLEHAREVGLAAQVLCRPVTVARQLLALANFPTGSTSWHATAEKGPVS